MCISFPKNISALKLTHLPRQAGLESKRSAPCELMLLNALEEELDKQTKGHDIPLRFGCRELECLRKTGLHAHDIRVPVPILLQGMYQSMRTYMYLKPWNPLC
jgi:hypothetical protein